MHRRRLRPWGKDKSSPSRVQVYDYRGLKTE